MTTTTSHFALDAPMALAPPTGDPLPVHAVDLALEREDGVLVEVRFTFTSKVEGAMSCNCSICRRTRFWPAVEVPEASEPRVTGWSVLFSIQRCRSTWPSTKR